MNPTLFDRMQQEQRDIEREQEYFDLINGTSPCGSWVSERCPFDFEYTYTSSEF